MLMNKKNEKKTSYTISDLRARWDKQEAEEKAFMKKYGKVIHWIRYQLPYSHYRLMYKLGDWKREVKWAWQRAFRGYDDSMVWGFYYENAKQTIAVLKQLRSKHVGSCYITDPDNVLKTKEKYSKKDVNQYDDLNVHKRYEEALDIMIEGFESLLAEDEVFIRNKKGEYDVKKTRREVDKLHKKWEKGSKLFIANYPGLWD